jgi:hypothetical protein
MKRLAYLTILLTLLMLAILSACAPKAESATPTATAMDLVFVEADRSMATPSFGTAQLPKSQGIKPLQLHSEPDTNAPVSGEIFPGAEGIVLGMDSTQKWVLVQFDNQVGWTPVVSLALMIAN